jgi:hypothetical protein
MEEFCSVVGGPSVVNTTLIVICVLLVCAVGGSITSAKMVKGRRNKPKTPEYCDVYPPRASHISLHSYEEIDVGPSLVTAESYVDVGKRPSYITVLSEANVRSDSISATEYANVAGPYLKISWLRFGTGFFNK